MQSYRYLKYMVDSLSSVQNAQDLSCLPPSMKRQGEVKKMVECQLRHLAIGILKDWCPQHIAKGSEASRCLEEPKTNVSKKIWPWGNLRALLEDFDNLSKQQGYKEVHDATETNEQYTNSLMRGFQYMESL